MIIITQLENICLPESCHVSTLYKFLNTNLCLIVFSVSEEKVNSLMSDRQLILLTTDCPLGKGGYQGRRTGTCRALDTAGNSTKEGSISPAILPAHFLWFRYHRVQFLVCQVLIGKNRKEEPAAHLSKWWIIRCCLQYLLHLSFYLSWGAANVPAKSWDPLVGPTQGIKEEGWWFPWWKLIIYLQANCDVSREEISSCSHAFHKQLAFTL